jgi:hypothetical protein
VPSASTSEPAPAEPRQVSVSWDRLTGWVERYADRHPGTSVVVTSTEVSGDSPDASSFRFQVPFAPVDEPSLDGVREHLARPWQVGVVLVRKGGFAVARLEGSTPVESKVGRRHVQSRSKAGGWSQQRFARRRDNQAQAAYDAASGYVHEMLLPHARDLDLLVTGGDRAAVDAVFAFRALTPLLSVPQQWLSGLPDPRRKVLDDAIARTRSTQVTVIDSSAAAGTR